MATPEIKQASSSSVQVLRLRRGEFPFPIEKSEESEAYSASESKVLVDKREGFLRLLGLGV